MRNGTDPLEQFVAHARSRGMDHQTIRMLLLSAGWRDKDVLEAVSAEGLGMPVPAAPDRGGAREAFFHLLTFASLYVLLVSLTVLFFRYVDYAFPDPAFEAVSIDYYRSTIRWSLAAVMVTYPLYLGLCRFLVREISDRPEKLWSGVRRWLTYLTLLFASVAMLTDFITLVFYFLDGELSVRFVLKVLVVLILAGLTFAYYFLSLRAPRRVPQLA